MSSKVTVVTAPPIDHAVASRITWRWVAIGIFAMSSSLNYLDRQLLAALAPTLQSEFGFSNAQYGALLSAFSIAYMLMSPLAGLFVDRVGLNVGIIIAASTWSLAG
ncbi:MAG: MFS transporter, partial [Acidobacteria bacterium]|nr:MFS transporter [Acidobacteriota bacterium]